MSDFRELTDDILSITTETFGEEVKFFPKSGGIQIINAIFDSAYNAIDPETEEIITANQSVLGVNLNDIEDNIISKGDNFEVRENSYEVIDVREDGQGGATVLVQKKRHNEKTDIRKYPRRNR